MEQLTGEASSVTADAVTPSPEGKALGAAAPVQKTPLPGIGRGVLGSGDG